MRALTVRSYNNVMGNSDVEVATLGVCAMVEPAWNVGSPTTSPSPTASSTASRPDHRRRSRLPRGRYGLFDRWPVVAEPFIQWVIEDDFAAGRPPYEDVGVLMTDDVRPYETLKLRILNAGHSTVTYMAALVGHTYIHEIMADPLLARYLQQFHDEEATPSLPPVRGIDVTDYKRVVAQRFANPAVKDQVARVCQDGTSKWPKFLVPTVESQLEQGGQVKLSALALAAWCQYLLGTDDAGAAIALSTDPRLDEAQAFARASVDDPAAFLGFVEVFGQRLASDRRFVSAFTEALTSLRDVGTYAPSRGGCAETTHDRGSRTGEQGRPRGGGAVPG